MLSTGDLMTNSNVGAIFALLTLSIAQITLAASERMVLPPEVTPNRYQIDITPDAAALTFKGQVKIDLSVHKATRVITLNSADIVIDSAILSDAKTTAFKAPNISYDTQVQTATFTWNRPVLPGPHILKLSYHGKIYQQASGLFALDYATPTGKARALFTQFENSDARRFVPCWDEPGLKAVFELSVNVPDSVMPLSNMPIASTTPTTANFQRVVFAPTPKMSSYLLFFSMGDFERVSRKVEGVDIGIVVKRGDTESTRYALDAAAEILPYYNRYFGTPYPLPKLDLIGGSGSSQFFGAMENWGAIFYFERDLLVDARLSTERDKQGVYNTVAHEMAHQWFGDLVTMAWWDDLWLNEGFASWMASKVTAQFHPEWKPWLQSLADKETAMREDAREGTHPIITPINDVLQAGSAFDNITYLKGAAVIRTLESYIGEDTFRAGVSRYMQAHAYGNTVTDDLWQAIDLGATRPIRDIAHDLTQQAGVPLIREHTARCSPGDVHQRTTRVELTQDHFAVDPQSTHARNWRIPVSIAVLGNAITKTVVTGNSPQLVTIAGCGTTILNTGQNAYFRSRYSNESLQAIAAHYDDLSSEDQLGVLYDTNSLAYAGDEPMSAFMGLTQHFPASADPVVTSALVGALQALDHYYEGLPAQETYRAYARKVLNPFLAHIGWDKTAGESDNTALLRSDLIEALSDMHDPEVISKAQKLFARFLDNPASFDPATRRSVLRAVATHADQQTWNQLHRLSQSAITELERQEFYVQLAAPLDVKLVSQALALAISPEPPPTIAPAIIAAAAYHHPQLAVDFVTLHWAQISAQIEPTTQSGYLPGMMKVSSDLTLIHKLDAFATAHIPQNARQDLRKSESSIRYNAMIRDNRLPEVGHWLTEQARAP